MQLSDHSLLRAHGFLDGRWVDAADGSRYEVIDAASRQPLGSVPRMSGTDATRAITAAAAAFVPWKRRTAYERGSLLRRWGELVHEASDDLARLITAEGGKPLAEARGEVAYATGFLEWFAEESRRAYGEVIPPHRADVRLLVLRQPVGVAAAITPWNFPAAMIARKVAAALAAGCTMVVKPAPQTPLTALALAVLAERAGLPAGVLNVLTADAESSRQIGDALCTSPTVRALSFTGSTAAGTMLAAKAAGTVKKVSLELGGNAPFIVFADADLEAAVAGAVASKFRNAGQTCVCANRFYVEEPLADAFATRLAEVVAGLNVGPGDEPDVAIGPLIDERAVEKVTRHVADAAEQGGRVLLGGGRHARGGTFFQPTVIAGGSRTMLVAREETFGPVAAVFPFRDEGEAIELANATESGLAAYFYSRDLPRAFRVAEALEVGMVGINTGMISTPVAPFGGVKASGIGREGGRHGMDEYQVLKYVCVGGIDPLAEAQPPSSIR
jgi:succinate-semialdehyde dehydrogenase/glutarate-semialdehyde dehydrogenase